jgi:hypothetical protein
VGTAELDILEATGIYKSFVGGHIHMVDILHLTFEGKCSMNTASAYHSR